MKNSKNKSVQVNTASIYNWINIFAFVIMVLVNILANTLPIGGNTSGQVSDRYPSLFTPAGFTFSIWSVIYMMLGITVIRQLISRQKNIRELTGKTGALFAISCLLNTGWIMCWHLGYITAATIIIFGLLLNLMLLMITVREDPLMSIAFGIYTAWITVASVASLFVQASYMGFNLISLTGEIFTIIAIVAAAGLLCALAYITENMSFTAVGIWAYTGIIISISGRYKNNYNYVALSAVIMIGIMIAVTAHMLIKKYLIPRLQNLQTTKTPAINKQVMA